MALGLRACLARSDLADRGDHGFDAAPPVPAFGPAPGDRVRQRKQLLDSSPPVLIAQVRTSCVSGGAIDHNAARISLIFPAEKWWELQPSTLYRHWYKAREKAGRKDLRWHDLRHSGAVLAAATGASLAELMARLGHSTPQAAMRYQHAAKGRDREIAALLSKLANNREA